MRLFEELLKLDPEWRNSEYASVQRWIHRLSYRGSISTLRAYFKLLVGNTIYIYEEREKEAISTLRHEVIEHLLFAFEKNYVEFVNSLIEVFNQIQKQKREELVEKIVNVL